MGDFLPGPTSIYTGMFILTVVMQALIALHYYLERKNTPES
jgi:hypothetical protein